MQRVLKYHLILRQLMSNTATTHEEYHLIQQAYEAMLDVSDYINEVRSVADFSVVSVSKNTKSTTYSVVIFAFYTVSVVI